jgi:CheY-like chemotaxis protein
MDRRRHRIFVIEDNVETAEAFALIFEARGFDVTLASNGADALMLLEHDHAYCAILLDLMLPVMDGREFRRAQRADSSLATIPVIVVSGDPHVAEVARHLEADNFLRKPIDPLEVANVVQRHCDGRACSRPSVAPGI